MRVSISYKTLVWSMLAVLVAALGLAAFVPAASASAQDKPARTALNQDLTIEQGEVVDGNVSVTNGNLTVNGEVRGDVAVVNGKADIEGKVHGNVVVVSGDIALGPKCFVGGNVATVPGQITRDPAAKVGGTVSAPGLSISGVGNQVVVAPATHPVSAEAAPTAAATWFDRFLSFFAKGMVSLLALVLGLLLAAIVPRRVSISSATLDAEPGPSIVVGL